MKAQPNEPLPAALVRWLGNCALMCLWASAVVFLLLLVMCVLGLKFFFLLLKPGRNGKALGWGYKSKRNKWW